jgi:cellulose synthase/poly-beta-1,6-N-acetylglucosamine synthase-like glycosyltransferase
MIKIICFLRLNIFVIDDGSSDGTGEIAKSYGVNVMRNDKNVGKAESISRVVSHFELTSRYDLIALMDADTKVAPEYFEGIHESFVKDEEVVIVCGHTKSSKHNWLTAFRSVAYFVSHFIYKPGQSNMGVITVAPGCSTTYRASVFLQLDWDSDTLVEDMDVTVQAHHRKLGKIVFQKKSIVYTQDPKTLRDYVKQMYRWDVGTWQVLKKYSVFTGVKKIDWEYKLLMVEGMIFSLLYVLLPLWLILFPSLTLLAILLEFCYIFAISTVVAIVEKRRDVIFYAPTFPVIRYIDCVLLLYSFWNIVIMRKRVSTWFSVSRYAHSSERSKS